MAAYIYIPGFFVVETDDAYVEADTVLITPKVSAYVTALHVTDNSAFSAGQLLLELDPRDFQDAVKTANANLQSARAGLTYATATLSQQARTIAADEAKVQGERLKDKVPLMHELKTMPWGNRTFQFRDPEGTAVSLYMPATDEAKKRFAPR